MSEPSNWPLTEGGVRIMVPRSILLELENNVLSHELYPTALGYYPSAKHHSMLRVEHDDYLLMYCIEGQGEIVAGDYKVALTAGDLIIVPPGIPHTYAANPDKPWSIFWCHFRGSNARAFYHYLALTVDSPCIEGLNDVALQSNFRSLISIASTGYSLPVFIHAANQLRQLLTFIERLKRRGKNLAASHSLEKVRAFMRESTHRNVSLEELAEISGLSKYHFNRKYKALTGYAPMQHFIHMKVEQACLLLDSTALNIAEIAFQLGYDDPLYFSRVFRKVTGLAPSQYRRHIVESKT